MKFEFNWPGGFRVGIRTDGRTDERTRMDDGVIGILLARLS